MRKKRYSVIVSSVIIGVILCSGSFAQEIPAHSDLEPQGSILTQAQDCFNWVIERLNDIKAPLDQIDQDRVDRVIALIDDRKNRLKSVDLYFSKQDTSGNDLVDFATLENYYTNDVGLTLENLVGKASQVAQKKKGFPTLRDALLAAVNMTPSTILSDNSKTILNEFITNGNLQAVAGAKGKSRISICTAYITPTNLPPSPDPLELAIEKRIAVIISTDN
jgi:hypothetical protein